MRHQLGVRTGRPVRGDGHQQPRVPRAVPRRLPGWRRHQPAQPAPGRQGARLHRPRLGHRGRLRRRVLRPALRQRPGRVRRAQPHPPRRAHRRRRRAPRPALRRSPGRRRAPGSRRARGDRPGGAHVHRRHDRSAQGRAARAPGRDAEPVPHRHVGAARPDLGLPAPDTDVPRRVDGRDPGHPGRRRHVGVHAAVRPGGRHGAHRAARCHPDGDGPDDDRHDAQPPGVRARTAGLAEAAHLRRLADAGRHPRPAPRPVPRPRDLPGLRHDRVARRCSRG